MSCMEVPSKEFNFNVACELISRVGKFQSHATWASMNSTNNRSRWLFDVLQVRMRSPRNQRRSRKDDS